MSKPTLTAQQQRVYDEAASRLMRDSRNRGVCTRDFPSHAECMANFETAVKKVVARTERAVKEEDESED